MKEQIMDLLSQNDARLRLNSISCLHHWFYTVDVDEPESNLAIEFDKINGVRFGFFHIIKSRDYDDIIAECQAATSEFMEDAAYHLSMNLEHGRLIPVETYAPSLIDELDKAIQNCHIDMEIRDKLIKLRVSTAEYLKGQFLYPQF